MNTPSPKPTLAIVVPCFNENEVLLKTAQQLLAVLSDLIAKEKVSATSFIYFIDDGSEDNTWEIISNLHQANNLVKGLKLSRNFGQQNALYAGLINNKSKADCIISIDADLQDSVGVIEQFIDRFQEGYEVIYGVRKQRNHDGWFTKLTSSLFYKLMSLLGAKIVANHAEYRLVSKRVITHLEQFSEFNLFLRGIFPLIGFKSTKVYYDREVRAGGKSKYPFKKLLSYSIDGLTALSTTPLRIIAIVGILFFISSILFGTYFIFAGFPHWAYTVLPIYFIGGIQLLSIGVIGEYLAKVYQETKARPKFIIESEII